MTSSNEVICLELLICLLWRCSLNEYLRHDVNDSIKLSHSCILFVMIKIVYQGKVLHK